MNGYDDRRRDDRRRDHVSLADYPVPEFRKALLTATLLIAILASFFIGLLPIAGSWTVYTPVALYLMVWRGDVIAGVVMLTIGFFVNTRWGSGVRGHHQIPQTTR